MYISSVYSLRIMVAIILCNCLSFVLSVSCMIQIYFVFVVFKAILFSEHHTNKSSLTFALMQTPH
jgi:hypothetical protein